MRALGLIGLLVLAAGVASSQWFYGGGTFAEEVVAAARSSLSDPRCVASDASGATVITCEAAPGNTPYVGVCQEDLATSCTADADCSGTQNYCTHSACFDGANAGQPCTLDSDCPSSECSDKIEFTLDKVYSTTAYANGDIHVEADGGNQVTVTSMKPPAVGCSTSSGQTSCRNGWGFDPDRAAGTDDPFDGRIGPGNVNIDPLPGALPYTANVSGLTSLMKAISGGGDSGNFYCQLNGGAGASCLHMMAVVTLGPNGVTPPAGAFRPPYSAEKGLFTTSNWLTTADINTAKLPSIPAASLSAGTQAALYSWDELEELVDPPHMGFNDRNTNAEGIMVHEGFGARTGLYGYHQNRVGATYQRLLRLGIDLDYAGTAQHQRTLHKVIQQAIDRYGGAKTGWSCKREKDLLPWIGLAAHILDEPLLATGWTDFDGGDGQPCFAEIDTAYDSPRYGADHPGDYLWGYTEGIASWDDSNGTWIGDPAGYADGFNRSYMANQAVGPWAPGLLFWLLWEIPKTIGDLDVTGWNHITGRVLDGWDWANTGGASHDAWTCGYVTTDSAYGSPDVCSAGILSTPAGCETSGAHNCDCSGGGGARYASAHGGGEPGGGTNCTLGTSHALFDFTGLGSLMWDDLRACADSVEGDGGPSATFPCTGMASAP